MGEFNKNKHGDKSKTSSKEKIMFKDPVSGQSQHFLKQL